MDERSVGALLYLLELQTSYAGEFYNINAFDQPGVELGKNFAYGLMGRKGYEKEAERIRARRKSSIQRVWSYRLVLPVPGHLL